MHTWSRRKRASMGCRLRCPGWWSGSGCGTWPVNWLGRRSIGLTSAPMPMRTNTNSSRCWPSIFFASPELLKRRDPALYAMLRDMFHQDTESLLPLVPRRRQGVGRNATCPCGSENIQALLPREGRIHGAQARGIGRNGPGLSGLEVCFVCLGERHQRNQTNHMNKNEQNRQVRI